MADAVNRAKLAAALKGMKKPNKYGAKLTVVDGVKHASKREATRFCELQLLERAGHISNLKRQVPFALHAPGGRKIGDYVADAYYLDKRTDCWVTEDSKGVRTPLYKWKKAHLKAEYGIDILET